jgi:hypothetical protein
MSKCVLADEDARLKVYAERTWWGGGYVETAGESISLGSILSALGASDADIGKLAAKFERANTAATEALPSPPNTKET